jgi:hypothetical protein
MTIPTLSNARLGYSFPDLIADVPGQQVSFSENSLVVGKNTRLFTLADTVGFGVKTQEIMPLVIEADKKFCLTGTGNITRDSRCSPIGKYA